MRDPYYQLSAEFSRQFFPANLFPAKFFFVSERGQIFNAILPLSQFSSLNY
jgi:hypothetical protein